MSDFKFYLPFPPSVNGYWRNVSGRQIISKRGREFRADAMRMLDSQMIGIATITQRMKVALVLSPPDKRKRDLDNYLKATLDAMTHAGVFVDDSQIDALSIERGEVEPRFGGVVVSINLIGD